MIDQDKKIRKGLPARRDVACYQVIQDITIPAGTLLRDVGGGKFSTPVGLIGDFSIAPKPGDVLSHFKRVVA